MSTLPLTSPSHPLDLGERFRRLVSEWKEQSRYLSNTAQIAMLKPYQRIIGMGLPAVPLILEEMQREPDQWFWALEAITDENPVPPEAARKSPPHDAGMARMGDKARTPQTMISSEAFPRLTAENHRSTSPASIDYNCIAWSVGDVDHWWQPGFYWPISAHPRDFGIAVLEQLFKALGYVDCGMNAELEPGFGKVALFGQSLFYTHAARQLANGKWTSKLGNAEDIEHDTPHDVAGGIYGEVVRIMKRPTTS